MDEWDAESKDGTLICLIKQICLISNQHLRQSAARLPSTPIPSRCQIGKYFTTNKREITKRKVCVVISPFLAQVIRVGLSLLFPTVS